jgi:hypothetical protein
MRGFTYATRVIQGVSSELRRLSEVSKTLQLWGVVVNIKGPRGD